MIYLDGIPQPPAQVALCLAQAGCAEHVILTYLATAEFASDEKWEDRPGKKLQRRPKVGGGYEYRKRPVGDKLAKQQEVVLPARSLADHLGDVLNETAGEVRAVGGPRLASQLQERAHFILSEPRFARERPEDVAHAFRLALNDLLDQLRPPPPLPPQPAGSIALSSLLERGLAALGDVRRAARFREAAQKATALMPPVAMQRLVANLSGGVHFYYDKHSLAQDAIEKVVTSFQDPNGQGFQRAISLISSKLVDDPQSLSIVMRMAGSPDGRQRLLVFMADVIRGQRAGLLDGGAFYNRMDGSVHLDGGGDIRHLDTSEYRLRGDALPSIYTHEFAHAIDGPEDEHSSSAVWQHAYATEIAPLNGAARLTQYACESPSEGFAEFARVLYCSSVPQERIVRDFPLCAAFFREQQLWPLSLTSFAPPAPPRI